MADERDDIDPKAIALIVDAVTRQISNVGRKEVVDTPPVFLGRDANAMREIARHEVDERLRERRVLSDAEIRSIAKEVAKQIVDESVRGLQNDIRAFLTEKQIEEIVIEILRKIGLRADDAHVDETRQIIEGILRGFKRRNELSGDFVKEMLKALGGWALMGILGAAVTYFSVKGGSH